MTMNISLLPVKYRRCLSDPEPYASTDPRISKMNMPPNPATLTEESYHRRVSDLGMKDPALAGVVSAWGNPPFWTHAPGFPGMVIAILAQQVSLESARAAYIKLQNAIDSVKPAAFLSLTEDALRAIGFSRQKASYVRGLAHGIEVGDINLSALELMDDEQARKCLIKWRGIGVWTAGTYLLFSMRRPDAWPSGDLALAKAVQELKGLASTPGTKEVDKIADQWRPLRAVAARILWHHYLCERGRFV